MAENYQTYRVTVEIEYASEVFPGDPDDVFQLAELEKPYVQDLLTSAVESFDSYNKLANFEVLSLVPVVE